MALDLQPLHRVLDQQPAPHSDAATGRLPRRRYKAWQALGRHVNKGARGIAIFAPLPRRVEDDNDERRRVLTGFKVVRVFDISQTGGEPLPTLTVPDVAGSSEALFDVLVAVV
ncbi:MAG: hypothetical protein M3Q30_14530 [Actinomycetota bacterium]|nr:hypothetical protein [Actinomycetota bacterium]